MIRCRPSSCVALMHTCHSDLCGAEVTMILSTTLGLKIILLSSARRFRMTLASGTRPLLNSQRGDSGMNL